MAIVQEHFMVGERDFIRTYSDKGLKVHGGFPEDDYDEATDPAEFGRTFVETDMPISENAEDILNILLGGEGS